MATIIFHAPYPLQEKPITGSAVRPKNMRLAFSQLGYTVIEVTGYASERRKKMAHVKRIIQQGEKIEFCYSESATIPMSFTEPKHFPLHLRIDYSFFRFLKNHNIPCGVFYRDIYWAFSEYRQQVGNITAYIMRLLYKHELKAFARCMNKVFLPTRAMGDFVPYIDPGKFVELPPGTAHLPTDVIPSTSSKNLNLLYVGAVGAHYQVDKILSLCTTTPHMHLTICTPEKQWTEFITTCEQLKAIFPDLNHIPNLTVVHKNSTELADLYAQADLALLFVQPSIYRSFAAPIKIFEYAGYEKPIIASKGTWAGNYVTEHNIGWAIDYTTDSLQHLLTELTQNPHKLQEKQQALMRIHPHITWQGRAQQASLALQN